MRDTVGGGRVPAVAAPHTAPRRAARKHTRAATTPAEHSRRVEWGEKWGAVGTAYKQAREARGK